MDDKLLQDLKDFGLSRYEAKTYLILTIHGPLTASLICERAKIPLSKVYEITKSLKRKSLIAMQKERPQKYKAMEPANALKNILEHKKEQVERLKIKTQGIIKNLKPNRENSFGLWTCKGKKAFLDKAMEILNKTTKTGFAVTSNFSRIPELDGAVIKAVKRGVEIKMLGVSMLNDVSKLRAEWYVRNGVKIKIIPMEIQPSFGLGDMKEGCIRVDNEMECEFIWSNNPSLINLMKNYFENLWEKADEFKY